MDKFLAVFSAVSGAVRLQHIGHILYSADDIDLEDRPHGFTAMYSSKQKTWGKSPGDRQLLWLPLSSTVSYIGIPMSEPENDREYYAFLCSTIKATWAIIDDSISGRKPFDFYPDAYRRFLDWLLRARDNIRSASVSGKAQRHINDLQFMLRDFFGDQGYACDLRTCFRWYRGGARLDGPFEPEPDIDDITRRFAAWNEAFLKEESENVLAQRQINLPSLPPP
jgi:hypothetical protein